MKIGERYEVQEDFEIRTYLGNKIIPVKKGDIGVVTKNGFIILITGQGKNRIIETNIELDGVDIENITNLLYTRLNNELGLKDILEENGIESTDMIECIESVLSDIF